MLLQQTSITMKIRYSVSNILEQTEFHAIVTHLPLTYTSILRLIRKYICK